MTRAFPILAIFFALSWTQLSASGMELRDEIAARALDEIGSTPADCWRGIRQESPMILFCGHVEIGELKPLRKAIDAAVLEPAGQARATGRWIWADLREFQRRRYETSCGLLEARIYSTRKMVVLGYPVPFGSADVEVIECDDSKMAGVFAGVPKCDAPDAVDEPPVMILQVPAVYPEAAKAVRISGSVEIRARILADGGVADVCVVESSRPGFEFERAAVAAVKAWRYRPAQKDGRPIECTQTTTVGF